MTRLTDRQLRWLAWAGWWFFASTLAVSGGLELAHGLGEVTAADIVERVTFVLVLAMFPISGLLVLRRQPRNAVGWLLLAVGCTWGAGGFGDAYARYGLVIDPGSVPLPTVGATVSNAIWAPALGLMATFLVLLFPDGRLPGARWRPLAIASGAVIATLTLTLLLSPGELYEGPLSGEPNPLGVDALSPVADAVLGVLLLGLTVCIVASACSLVVRFRRSQGVERQQLKWMTTAAAILALTFFTNTLLSLPYNEGTEPGWLVAFNSLAFATWALLPAAVAAAVLRHGLYDIDVVINRALVYGALTATLAATYLGSVLLLQLLLRPLTERSDLAVAASTLAVAAGFGPARRRIQTTVDRRFYRHKYDAARTVADFGARLRRELDLDAIGADLVRIADDAVRPTAVSLWLGPAVTVPERAGPRKDTP